MKSGSLFVCGVAALFLSGCAGPRLVEGLGGRYDRTFMADDEDGNRAQVVESWQFHGAVASSNATWTGVSQGAHYTTTVDQGWNVKYRGRGLYSLTEKGRRISGPPLAEIGDEYELEQDGAALAVDGGPSDTPLHRAYEAPAPAPKPSPASHTTTVRKKKKR